MVFGVSGWFGLGGSGARAFSPFGVTGTVTIKMISNTRRTSISGVTLIPETALPVPTPLPMPINNLQATAARCESGSRVSTKSELLACRDARGDEADVVDFSLMAHVDHFGDLVEVKRGIALDEHHLFLARGEDLGQLRLEVGLGHRRLVDHVRRFALAVRKHLDHDR